MSVRCVAFAAFWGLTSACSGSSSHAPNDDDDAPCEQLDSRGRLMCGDFGPALGTTAEVLVVGRLVTEDADFDLATHTPNDDLTQAELPNSTVEMRVSNATGQRLTTLSAKSDDEGWLSERLDLERLGLSPGTYTVDVWLGEFWMASVSARLLPPDYRDYLVVSDIDLTYLDTDFQSVDAVAELLAQPAGERVPLPAMPVVYAGLRAGEEGDQDRPLAYLSGSPLFFRRVLAERMALDQIVNDGVTLKPIQLLLMHELLAGIQSTDWVDWLRGDVDGLLGSFEDQLGFKLTALFSQQLKLPPNTRLLLLGDDSEMDHVTYALFHRTLSGELSVPELLDTLDDLSVDSFWRDAIERVAPQASLLRTPAASPVDGIFINQTEVPNLEERASAWQVAGLSRHHRGAWPLALELQETGWIAADAVARVRAKLLDQGQTEADLDAAADAAIADGFLEAR